MNTLKKLMLAACVAMVGLCGTAWAEVMSAGDYQFDIETGTITGYTGKGGDVVIPAQIGGVDVKIIESAVFQVNTELTSVMIPAGVTKIGEFAFRECHNLTSVSFAEGSQLERIEKSVYNGCEKLANVSFPAGCPLKDIGNSAFYGSGLTSITIPAGVTNIGDSVFYRCSGLASVTFEDGSQLKTMGNEVFENCTALTGITIPAGVMTIGARAFLSCSSLASVTFAQGSQLKVIGEMMFGTCTALTEVTIPASVTGIGQYAFVQCSSLASVTFEAGSQLASIGGSVFNGCPLTGILLPEGLTDIGQAAFAQCTNLTTVTIPAGVTSVGQGAFIMCSNLTEVTVLATKPPTAVEDAKLFDADMTGTRIATLKAIKVPAGSVEDYKGAAGWITYADLITAGSAPAPATVEATYYAWNGETVAGPFTTNAIPVTAEMETLNSGWYVVQGTVAIDRSGITDEELYKPGLKVNGDVHLILADGAELVVTGATKCAGIEVGVVDSVTNSLTIYGQQGQTGKLTVAAGQFAAGIGGNFCQSCGLVTINGGIVTATGNEHTSYSAGIGGGAEGSGGIITINAGTVTAIGGSSGAGIGNGGDEKEGIVGAGGVVVINGGEVTATGANCGAGIGGSQCSGTGTLTINSGIVTANGGMGAAGVGGGLDGTAWTVVINGGKLTTTGNGGAGIGSGLFMDVGNGNGGDVTVTGGDVTAISLPMDIGTVMQSDGIGGGAKIGGEGRGIPGTLNLSGYEGVKILAGMDTNGVKVTEVAAADYLDHDDVIGWHTNCYVHILKGEAPAEKISKLDFSLRLEDDGKGGGDGMDDATVTISGGAPLAEGEIWAWASFSIKSVDEYTDARTHADEVWSNLNAKVGSPVGSVNLMDVTNGLEAASFGTFTSPSHDFLMPTEDGRIVFVRAKTDGTILAVGGVKSFWKNEGGVIVCENEMFGTGKIPVAYYAWDESAKDVVLKEPVEAIQLTDEITALEDGKWYVAIGKCLIEREVSVSGAAHLVLWKSSPTAHGAEVGFQGKVTFGENAALSIYGMSKVVYGDDPNAGKVSFDWWLHSGPEVDPNPTVVETSALNIHGAKVHVAGDERGNQLPCGTINVCGGIFEASGYGEKPAIWVASALNVYGGWVKAHVYDDGTGAAIGGAAGQNGCAVNVYGGWVEAFGGEGAAGIGAGAGGESHGNLTIGEGVSVWVAEDEESTKSLAPNYAETRERYVWITSCSEKVKFQKFTATMGSEKITLKMPSAPGDGYRYGVLKMSEGCARCDIGKLYSADSPKMELAALLLSGYSEQVENGSLLVGEMSFAGLTSMLDAMVSLVGPVASEYTMEFFDGDTVELDRDGLDAMFVCRVEDNENHGIATIGGCTHLADLQVTESKGDEMDPGDEPEPVASDWAKLQAALTNGEAASLTCEAFEHTFENGTNFVKLLKDVVANTDVDTCLVIASGSRAVIDLNGQTLDRGLAGTYDLIKGDEGIENGEVIFVSGHLTVQDTSADQRGKITGGCGQYAGGVFVCLEDYGKEYLDPEVGYARFVLMSGSICGNYASYDDENGAGGVAADLGGEFLMLGGCITNNTGLLSGGVGISLETEESVIPTRLDLRGGVIAGNSGAYSGGVTCMCYPRDCLHIGGTVVVTNNAGLMNAGGVSAVGVTLGGSAVIKDNVCAGYYLNCQNLLVMAEGEAMSVLPPLNSETDPISEGAEIWVDLIGNGFDAPITYPVRILTNCTADAAQYFHSEIAGTRVFFKDDALWIEEGASAPLGSPENPWPVPDEDGNPTGWSAYTNGTDDVIFTGNGPLPSGFGANEPFDTVLPKAPTIYVPHGQGDVFKDVLDEPLDARVQEVLNYLAFTARNGAVTIGMKSDYEILPPVPQLETANNPMGPWATFTAGETTIPLVADQTVYFRRSVAGTVERLGESCIFQFAMTPVDEGATVEASGNVMSLLDQTCASVTVGMSAFPTLFQNCSVLTTAPELPATVLARQCYINMFMGCSSLTNAPALPATDLARQCYDGMFNDCVALTAAPELPATNLVAQCYEGMFVNCSALTDAPALPAKTLASDCYNRMFQFCTALTNAPALPAETLAVSCYANMFWECTALKDAPALPAKELVVGCYASMFGNCVALTNAPALPASALTDDCYTEMFCQCGALDAVSVEFENWGQDEVTRSWMYRVAETGVFTCPIELPVITDRDHIPEGWVVKKRFTLPTGLAMGSYVVSNETSGAVLVEPVGSEPGSEEYEVTVGDTIKIYMQPAEGYVVGGENPLTLNLNEGINLKEVMPWAVRPIPYQAWDEANKVMTNAVCTEKYEYVTPSTHYLRSGWYVVQGNVMNNRGVTILGDAHLILCDGAELAFEQADAGRVIVLAGRSLTIYGQTEGTGKLFAQGGTYCAGIGGIGEQSSFSAGAITINGGQVTAQGGCFAAGIGGGGEGGTGGTVTINGGKVLAISNDARNNMGGGGAGIGGSAMGAGGALTINGGEVTAISYPINDGGTLYYAEGIGAGAMGGDSGTLDLSGYTGKYYIYAGMDVTGVEAEEVQAGDFSTWHTNLYVQITTTPREKPAAEGSPEKPWKVGTNGNGQPAAYTNGNNEVVVTGEGLPKPYGGEGDPAPWAGFDPEIETIYVPQNTEDIYKHQWPDDAEKIVGVPDYLSFTAKDGDVKISFGKNYSEIYGLEYSFDPIANEWYPLPEFDLNGAADDSDKVFVPNGQTLYIRKAGDAVTLGVGRSDQKKGTFKMERVDENGTATVEAGGNVMSLLDKTCRSKEVDSYAFYYLFCDCRILTAAPKLPATKLGVNCYEFMFDSCSALKAAPELPATELESGCYCYMFYGCSALESIELPASELKEACYRFMFQFCSKLSMVKVGFDAWSDLAYVCEDWLLGVAETGTFICSQALENNFAAKGLSYGASTIPEGWRTARDYLSFTAKDGDITLSLEKFANPFDATFEYSFSAGAENWTTYSEHIQITKDQTVYFRKQGAAVEAISRDGGNFWRFVFDGDEGATVAAGGNVMSLLDPTCQSRTIGKSGLVYLFDFMDRLTSAPSIEADHLGENACEGMFRGCANLASGIEIVAEENLDSGAIRSLLGSAAKVDEITVAFKEWAGANFSIAWVDNVAPFGVFHCPSELPIEVDINHIPEGWIVFKKFSIPVIEGLKHVVTNSAGEVIAPCAVSQDGTKTYEVLAGDEETYAVHFEDVDGYPVVGEDTLNLGDLSGSVEIGSDEYPLPERGVLLKVEGAPGHSTFTIFCGEDVFAEGPDELTTRVSPYVTTKVVYTTDEGWAYEFASGLPVTEKVQLETEVTDPTEVSAPTEQPDNYQLVNEAADLFDEAVNAFIDSLTSYPPVVKNEADMKQEELQAKVKAIRENPLPSSDALAELENAEQDFTAWKTQLLKEAQEFQEALEKDKAQLQAMRAELEAMELTSYFADKATVLFKSTEDAIANIESDGTPPTAERIKDLAAAKSQFVNSYQELKADVDAFLKAKQQAKTYLDGVQNSFKGLMSVPEIAYRWGIMNASQDPDVQKDVNGIEATQMALKQELADIQKTLDSVQKTDDVSEVSSRTTSANNELELIRTRILSYQIPTYTLTVNVSNPHLVCYSVYAGEKAQDMIVEKANNTAEYPGFVWETPVKVVYHLTDDWYAFDGAANKEVRDFVALEDMMMGDRQIAEPALGNLKELVSTYENATGQFAAWEKDADPMPQNLKDQIKAAVDSARASVEALYAKGVPVGETCNNINQSVDDIRLQVESLLAQGYVALAFDLSNTLKDKHGQFLDANQGQIGALYQYGTPEANKLLEDLALLQNDVEFFCYQQLGEVKDAKSYADYVARMQELLARMEDLQTRLDESVRVIAALPLVAERNADSGTLRVIVRQTLREGEKSWRIMWFMRGELDDVISRAADIVGRQVGEVFDSNLFELIPCKFAEYSSDYELSDIAAPLDDMAACVIVAIDSQGMVTRIGGVDRLDELGRGEVKGADVIGAEPLWVRYYESKDGQLYDRDALAKPIASSPKEPLLLDQNEQSHYVVLGNCDVDSLVVKGGVNLILGRGCHLSVKNGIVIEEGSLLRICSEHDFRFEPHLMGQMSVDKSAVVAERPAALCGFQSSQLQIHGGKVDIASATAGVKVGAFDMLNGEVTVTAGTGYAGVDLAYVSSRCLLDAGTLTVTGGAGAAAIGGNVGENGGQFSMNRGLLRANATPTDEGKCGAGIGAGAGGVTHGGFDFQNSELRAFAANSAAEKLNLAPNYAETREPSVLITDGGDLIRALPFTASRQGNEYFLVMNQAPQARYLAVALTKANVFRPYGAGSTVGAALWEAVAEIATGARTAVGELTEESFFRLLRERGADSVEKIEIFSPEGCVNIASLEQVILVEFDDRGRVVRMGGVNALSELDGRGTVIDSPIGRTMTGEAAAIVAQDFTLAADSYRLTLTMTSAADNGQAWAWARVGDGELYEGLDDFVNGLLGKTVGEEAFRPLSASELPAIFGDGNWGLFTDNFAQFDRIDPKAASTLRGLMVFKVSVLPVSETGSEMPILAVGGVKNVDQLREGQRLSNQYGEGLERIANQNFTVTRQGDEEQSLLVQPADPLQGDESWHYLALGADEASWRLETINGNLSVYRGATVGDLTVDDLNYLGLSCQIAYEASFAVSGDAEAVYLFKVDGYGRVLTIGLADKLSTLYDPGMSRGDVFGKTFITAQRLGVTRSGDEWTVSVFAAEAQKAEEAGDRLVYFAYADAADAETAWSKTQGVLSGGMTEVGTVKLAEFPEPAAKGALASDEPFAALPANCTAVFAAWVRGANDVIVTLGGVTEFATIADGETRQAEAGDSRMRPFDFTVSRVEDERRTFWLRSGPRKANEQWTWMAVPSRVMYLLEQEFESSELLLENLRREMFVSKDAGLVKGVQKQKEPAAIQMLRLMLGRGYFGQSTDVQLDVQDIPADTDLLLVMKTDRGTGATCGQGLVIGLEQLPPGGEKRNQVDGRLVYATVDEAGNRTLHETAEPVELVTELTRSIGGNRWYVLGDRGLYEKIRAGDRLTVNGAANVIVPDGSTSDAFKSGRIRLYGGIAVNAGATLNVYGQQLGNGALQVVGADGCAAIGGDEECGAGTINFYGGIVEAESGLGAAAIGGGYLNGGENGAVNLYGGVVIARAFDAAAIGGGQLGSGCDVVLHPAASVICDVEESGLPGIGGCDGMYDGTVQAFGDKRVFIATDTDEELVYRPQDYYLGDVRRGNFLSAELLTVSLPKDARFACKVASATLGGDIGGVLPGDDAYTYKAVRGDTVVVGAEIAGKGVGELYGFRSPNVLKFNCVQDDVTVTADDFKVAMRRAVAPLDYTVSRDFNGELYLTSGETFGANEQLVWMAVPEVMEPTANIPATAQLFNDPIGLMHDLIMTGAQVGDEFCDTFALMLGAKNWGLEFNYDGRPVALPADARHVLAFKVYDGGKFALQAGGSHKKEEKPSLKANKSDAAGTRRMPIIKVGAVADVMYVTPDAPQPNQVVVESVIARQPFSLTRNEDGTFRLSLNGTLQDWIGERWGFATVSAEVWDLVKAGGIEDLTADMMTDLLDSQIGRPFGFFTLDDLGGYRDLFAQFETSGEHVFTCNADTAVVLAFKVRESGDKGADVCTLGYTVDNLQAMAPGGDERKTNMIDGTTDAPACFVTVVNMPAGVTAHLDYVYNDAWFSCAPDAEGEGTAEFSVPEGAKVVLNFAPPHGMTFRSKETVTIESLQQDEIVDASFLVVAPRDLIVPQDLAVNRNSDGTFNLMLPNEQLDLSAGERWLYVALNELDSATCMEGEAAPFGVLLWSMGGMALGQAVGDIVANEFAFAMRNGYSGFVTDGNVTLPKDTTMVVVARCFSFTDSDGTDQTCLVTVGGRNNLQSLGESEMGDNEIEDSETLEEYSQVHYLEWDKSARAFVGGQAHARRLDAAGGVIGNGQWYVNSPDDAKHSSETLTVQGTANLVIRDMTALQLRRIVVGEGATLNVYGQSMREGMLMIKDNSMSGAAFGADGVCGTINLHGVQAMVQGTAVGIGGMVEGGELNVLGANLQVSSKGPAIAGCALNVYGGRVLAASMSGSEYPAINDGISLKSTKLSIFSGSGSLTELEPTTVAAYTAGRKPVAKIAEYVNVIVPQVEHVNVTATSIDIEGADVSVVEPEELPGTGCVRYRFERFDNVKLGFAADTGYQLRSPDGYVFFSIDGDRRLAADAVVVTAVSQPPEMIGCQPFTAYRTTDENGQPCCEVKPIGELGPGEQWLWMSCDKALAQTKGTVDDDLTTEEALVEMLDGVVGNVPVGYVSVDMFRAMLPLDRSGVGGADAVIRLPADTDMVCLGKVYDTGLGEMGQRYSNITVGLATNLFERLEGGDAGYNDLGEEPTDDEIEAILKEAFPQPHEVTKNEDGSFRITLKADMTGPVEIPDNLGPITLDMNGFTITGVNGVNGADGGNALVITDSGDVGADTELTITEPNEKYDADGDIVGGNGADGQWPGNGGAAIRVDTKRGVRINVEGTVQVVGGKGGTVLGDEDSHTKPGTPGKGVDPSGTRGDRAPGSDQEGEVGGTFAPWAKATLAAEAPDNLQTLLPDGVTVVGNELWFWKRVGTNGKAVGFDFTTLDRSWIKDGEIRFVAGSHFVDQFLYNRAGGLAFVGASSAAVVVKPEPVKPADPEEKPVKPVLKAGMLGGKDSGLPDLGKHTTLASTGKSIFQSKNAPVVNGPLMGSYSGAPATWRNLAFTMLPGTVIEGNGGAINAANVHALTVADCAFANIIAGELGGAICAAGLDEGGLITNSTFTACSVSDANGLGGAIYATAGRAPVQPGLFGKKSGSDPGLAVVDCIFALNVAESGGAICTALTYEEEEPIALKVSGTSFIGNFADYNGGAIYAGGKVELLDAEVDRGTFFGSNEAGVYGGALAAGGTEDTFAGTEVFVGSNTVFACNKVENDWFGEAMGGAINLPENCALTVRNALFTNNVARCSGGAVYGVYGGAVCTATGCTNRFEKTAFVDNRAIASGTSGNRYAAGGAVSDLAGVTLVDTCVFDANVVEGESRVGAALDFEYGEETAVVNSTFRNANVEAVSVYAVAAAVIRNCVIVGNAENEEWYDLYVEETPGYELTFTAYGKLYTAGATEVACSNNFAGCTAEAVYRGETLYLATNEYNKVAALGYPQPGVTDFVGVEYGSTFWGTSMGAFETPAIYPVDQLGFDIYVDPLELAWTGTQVQPSTVVVTNPYTHAELTEGVDYTVGFRNNVNSTDKALVVVTGIGNYAGTATTNYWITSYLVKYYACEKSTKGEYERPLDAVELGSLSGSNVVATIAPPPGYALDPYHEGTLTNGTVTLFDSAAGDEANGRLVLKVFYAPSGDDDVPDKYQRKITYKVANGWWNDAEDGLDRTVWVTLFDTDGKWSETGIGKLTDIPSAGQKPFSGYAKAGVWYSDPPTVETLISPDSPALPFFLYVYCAQPQGGTGRGGRGSSGSVTQADLDALKSHLVTKLTITDFAYVNGKAAGEARAAVVDELTGQTILDELLRRTKIDILATPSLDKGEWSVIGSPTTDGEGGWGTDERPAAETPAQMFFKLRLR